MLDIYVMVSWHLSVGTSDIVIIVYPNIVIPQYFTRFVTLLP